MAKIYRKFIVDEDGKKTGVILSVKEYRELLEDLHDLVVIAERRKEPTVSFEELKSKLKKRWHPMRSGRRPRYQRSEEY